jgi:hypothetical protein
MKVKTERNLKLIRIENRIVDVESFTAVTWTRQCVPETGPRAPAPGAGGLTGRCRRSNHRCTKTGGLTTPGIGLTVYSCIVRELTPIALDHFSGRDPVRRNSPKGCSRLARPPRMSQTATGMKREWNWGLEERIRTKGIKTEKYW